LRGFFTKDRGARQDKNFALLRDIAQWEHDRRADATAAAGSDRTSGRAS
jgi:hypothetical protein